MFNRTSMTLLTAGLAWLVAVPAAIAAETDDENEQVETETQTQTTQTTQTAQAPGTQTQTTTTRTETELEDEDEDRARPFAGIDADLGLPSEDALDTGWGLGLRLGSGIDVEAVRLDLEGGFGYNRFPGAQGEDFPDTADDARSHLWRVVAGLRLGALMPIVPYVFAHVGYGRQVSDIGEDEDQAANGIAWDVGLGSDLVAFNEFQLGVHATYQSFNALDDSNLQPDEMRWFGVGIHGQFGF
jgi:hypothetical protein